MSKSSHSDRYFTKLLVGFASLISCILVIYYSVFEVGRKGDWYFWATLAAFLLCSGVYFSINAAIHKIKSDFSKRQKVRDMQKSEI